MQRRIEQTNRDGKPSHLAKDSHKVAALQGQKFLKSFLASAHAGFITGQNFLIDGGAFPGAF